MQKNQLVWASDRLIQGVATTEELVMAVTMVAAMLMMMEMKSFNLSQTRTQLGKLKTRQEMQLVMIPE